MEILTGIGFELIDWFNDRSRAICRTIPTGEKLYEFEYPIKNLRNLTPTSDGSFLVGPGFEKLKDTLFIFNSKTGLLSHKIVLKYANFKDYFSILAVPKRATQVLEIILLERCIAVESIVAGIIGFCRLH